MKDGDRIITIKQAKDAARLLLGQPGGIIPGAEQGIKALLGLLVVTSRFKESQ